MGVNPSFNFYPKDWLSSVDIQLMSDAEYRVYHQLLCYCWEHDGLPIEIARMAPILQRSQDEFRQLWEGVKSKFHHVTIDGKKKLYNPKLLQLRSDILEKRGKKQHAANVRWGKDGTSVQHDADAMQVHQECNADASNLHMLRAGAPVGLGYKLEDSSSEIGKGVQGETLPRKLARRYCEIRATAAGLEDFGEDELGLFTAVMAHLLNGGQKQAQIESVLVHLASDKARREWEFGLLNAPKFGKVHEHALVTTFATLFKKAGNRDSVPAETKTQPQPSVEPVRESVPANLDRSGAAAWVEAARLAVPDAERFATWIKPLEFLGANGDEAWLAAPTLIHRNWISANFRDQLEQATGYTLHVIVRDAQ